MRIHTLSHPRSLTFKVIVCLLLLMIPFVIWAAYPLTPASSNNNIQSGLPPLPPGFEFGPSGQDPFVEPPANAVAWGVLNAELDPDHFDGLFAIPGRDNPLNLPNTIQINPVTLISGTFDVGTADWAFPDLCAFIHLHGTFGGHSDPAPTIIPGFFTSACGHGALFYVLQTLSNAPLTVGSSGDFLTIQAAIDAANNGDTIQVIDSVHTESGISVNTNDLIIMGLGQNDTIVQGDTTPGTGPDRIFTIPGGINTTIQDMTIQHGNAPFGQGGGVLVNGVLELLRTNVRSNTANQGGGIYNAANASLLFDGSDVTLNIAVGDEAQGGGIWNGGDLFITNGSTVNSNVANGTNSAKGGGIYNAFSLFFDGSDVGLNQANGDDAQGGGLWNGATGTMTISGADILGNQSNGSNSAEGGGLWNDVNGNVTITGGNINGNQANGGNNAHGGGIHNNGDFDGGANITSGDLIISNNSANGDNAQGGGVWNSGDFKGDGEEDSADFTILGNTANGASNGEGGGLWNDVSGNVTLTQADVSGNTATGSIVSGGGIANNGGNADVTDSAILNNQVSTNNFALGGGITNSNSGTVTLTGSAISNNTAESDSSAIGGGVANLEGTVTVTDSEVTDNTAGGPFGYGGGIFNSFGTLTVTNGSVDNNTATNAGGGILSDSGTNDISDSTIDNNSAQGDLFGGGGGLFITSGAPEASTTITNSTIDGNTSADSGGGIFNDGGTLNIRSSTISSNLVTGDDNQGGGIANSAGATATVEDSTLSNNVATLSGGGIANDGDLTINRTTFSENSALNGGGAANGPTGDATVVDSPFTTNTASFGGGFFNLGNASMIGFSFNGNIASQDGGGFWNGGTATVVDKTFTGNSAERGGGFFNLGNASMIGFSFNGNTASQDGGGFWNGGTATVVDKTFTGNSAERGGAIYNAGGANLDVKESSLSGNTADNDGGAILNDGGNLGVSDTSIADNTSADSGGGVRNDGGAVTIVRGTISGNQVTGDNKRGGGLLNSGIGASAQITNSTISGNIVTGANGGGGGLSNLAGGTTVLVNTTITQNSSTFGGGVDNAGGTILTNTIVADNTAPTGQDFNSPVTVSLGNNLIGNGAGAGGITNGVNNDIVGTPSSPIDPLLGALQDNGGPTQTHALLNGSPALDAGNDLKAPAIDQRGVSRPQGLASDIGSFESEQAGNQPPVLNPIGDQALVGVGPHQIDVSADDPNTPPNELNFNVTGQSLVFGIAQSRGFQSGDDFENTFGQGERWIKGNDNQFNNPWYFILPNGELREWDGANQASGELIANVGSFYHQNLDELANPSLDAPVDELSIISNNDGTATVNLTIAQDFDGAFQATVNVGDGEEEDSETFLINVIGGAGAPTLTFIPNQAFPTFGTHVIPVQADDTDTPLDQLFFSVEGESWAFQFDQIFDLQPNPGGDLFNQEGQLERWMRGMDNQFGNDWYFILPNGELSAWNGQTGPDFGGASLGAPGKFYHDNLDALLNAIQNPPVDALGISANPDGTAQVILDPQDDFKGTFHVYVNVTDGLYNISHAFMTTIVNSAPLITSTPTTSATVGQLYFYDILATDDAGDTLTFSLGAAPADMTINPLTGRIEWTPVLAQVGNHLVGVVVEDDGEPPLFDSQLYSVAVEEAPPAFTVRITTPANDAEIKEGTSVTVDYEVVEQTFPLAVVRLFVDGEEADVQGDPISLLDFIAPTLNSDELIRVVTIRIEAQDTEGNIAEDTIQVIIKDCPPIVGLVGIADGQQFFEQQNASVEVDATDDDGIFNMQLFLNDILVGEDSTSPYNFNFLLPKLDDNEPTRQLILSALATDIAGSETEASIDIVVIQDDAPPSAEITSPTAGQRLLEGDIFTVEANAADNVGVKRVFFEFDGEEVGQDNEEPFSVDVLAPALGEDEFFRSLNISAIAEDVNGNQQASDPVEVIVEKPELRQSFSFGFPLHGLQESPAVNSGAEGECQVTHNPLTGEMQFLCEHNVQNLLAAHIHTGRVGVNGPVVINLGDPTSPINTTINNPSSQLLSDLLNANLYINVHSNQFPDGEIRGQIAPFVRHVRLQGAQEVPPVNTNATGVAVVALNQLQNRVDYSVNHSVTSPTAAHIHRAVVSINGDVVIDLGDPTSPIIGSWDKFSAQPFTSSDVNDLLAGDFYINVHSSQFPGGEIRGQISNPATLLVTKGIFTPNPPNPIKCGDPNSGLVTFDHSLSFHTDARRQIISYAWDVDSERNGVPFNPGDDFSSSDRDLTFDHAYTQFGTYTVTLKVTDDKGATATQTLNVVVNQVNQSPNANAGGPYDIDLGDDLALDGSASNDPDAACGDNIVSFLWDLDNDGTFDDASGESPVVPSAFLAGLQIADPATGAPAHVIKLRVRDSFGQSGTTETTLKIFANAPKPVINVVTTPQICGQGVGLDASGSTHGRPGREIVQYLWDFDYDGNFNPDFSSSDPLASFIPTRFGDIEVALQVTDNNSPPVSVITTAIVNSENAPPVANGGGPYNIIIGQNLQLDATGSSDPNASCGDSIVSYEWDVDNDGLFGTADTDGAGGFPELTSSAPTLSAEQMNGLNWVAGQEFTVSLKVTDSLGESNTATTTVNVQPDNPSEVVSEQLTLEDDAPQTGLDPAPAPNAPAGVFTITATFTNTSFDSINNLAFQVVILTNNNLLLNADGGPGGVGSTLTVDLSGIGNGDDVLDPGETVTVEFQIGLQTLAPFDFFVDAFGVPSN